MRSLLGRWFLLVLLVLGVVAMHHAPLAPTFRDESPRTSVSTASQHARSGDADRTVSAVDGSEEDTSAFAVASGGESGIGHGLLHLCLTILTAAAAFLAVSARRVVLPTSGPKRQLGWTSSNRQPPSLPVPRRLAVLCVLRL